MYISSGCVVPTFVQYTSWRWPGVVGCVLSARSFASGCFERIGVDAGAARDCRDMRPPPAACVASAAAASRCAAAPPVLRRRRLVVVVIRSVFVQP